jgi:hypothetical protein
MCKKNTLNFFYIFFVVLCNELLISAVLIYYL